MNTRNGFIVSSINLRCSQGGEHDRGVDQLTAVRIIGAAALAAVLVIAVGGSERLVSRAMGARS